MRISIAPSRGLKRTSVVERARLGREEKRRCDRGLLNNVLFMIRIGADPKHRFELPLQSNPLHRYTERTDRTFIHRGINDPPPCSSPNCSWSLNCRRQKNNFA